MTDYKGLFKNKYKQLHGRDWIRSLNPDDFRVFVHMGLEAMEYGHLGGIARASTATRDSRGRFARG